MRQTIRVPIYSCVTCSPEDLLMPIPEKTVPSYIEVWKGISPMEIYDQLPKKLRFALQQTGGNIGEIFEAIYKGYSIEEIIDILQKSGRSL